MRGTPSLLLSCVLLILSAAAGAAHIFLGAAAMAGELGTLALPVQLQWLDPSGSVAALDWPVTTRLLWGRAHTELGDFATPEYQVSITPPPGLALESTPGQILVSRTTSPVALMRLAVKKADGANEDVGLRIEFQQQAPALLVHQSCERAGIKLIARGGLARFQFLAISCRLESNRYLARVFASDDVTLAVNDEFSGFVQNSTREILMEFRRGERVRGIEQLGSLRVNKKISDEVATFDIVREPMFGPEPEPLAAREAEGASFFSVLQKHWAVGTELQGAAASGQSAFGGALVAKGHFELPRRGLLALGDVAVALPRGISTMDAVVGKKFYGVAPAVSVLGGFQVARLILGGSGKATGTYAFPELGVRANFDGPGESFKLNDLQLAILPTFSAPPSLELRAEADTGWRLGNIRVGVAGKFQFYNVGHSNVSGFGLGLQGWF